MCSSQNDSSVWTEDFQVEYDKSTLKAGDCIKQEALITQASSPLFPLFYLAGLLAPNERFIVSNERLLSTPFHRNRSVFLRRWNLFQFRIETSETNFASESNLLKYSSGAILANAIGKGLSSQAIELHSELSMTWWTLRQQVAVCI